jgi:hypothetical protein
MAYIIHYSDESNENVIKEAVVLMDGMPDESDIEDFQPYGYNKIEIHHITDDDFPCGLPLDRCLEPVYL